MSMTADKYIERLNDILQKKKVFLQDILTLTEAQSTTITEDGTEHLQQLIDKKQAVIDVINKLDDEFNVYFQRLKSSLNIKSLDELDAFSITEAGQLKKTTGEILGVITAISEIEKQNDIKCKKLLDQLGGEIRKFNQGKKVNTAYVPRPINIPSYFIDKKK
jgi:hypothetical protein